MKYLLLVTVALLYFKITPAQRIYYQAFISANAEKIEQKVNDWRHDFHQNPELGNMETCTSAIAAKHLQLFGLEVKTGIAGTGVVRILRGNKPEPVVALRADMDALPVTKRTDVTFASKVKQYTMAIKPV